MARGVIQRPQLYDYLMQPLEDTAYGRCRQRLFRSLTGKILELGIGTGRNLDVYSPQANVTGVDIEPQLVRAAATRAPRGVEVLVADAQQLPFPMASFDCVTAALVFCTIPEPIVALREVARVLRPTGRFVLLEHTVTDRPVPDALLNVATPFWKKLTGGCMINRDTVQLLENDGWQLQRHERLVGGLVRMIEAVPPPSMATLFMNKRRSQVGSYSL